MMISYRRIVEGKTDILEAHKRLRGTPAWWQAQYLSSGYDYGDFDELSKNWAALEQVEDRT